MMTLLLLPILLHFMITMIVSIVPIVNEAMVIGVTMKTLETRMMILRI